MTHLRIALDAMGTDTHPDPELAAAARAFRAWGDPVLLVGPKELLTQRLRQAALEPRKVEIVDAPEVLAMTDKPADSARGKPVSSMAVGLDLVKSGGAEAFVTCGNTGGAMANALFRLGRIRGVKRPGLTGQFPVRTGHALVLDIGANTDCKPEYLAQFAILGSVYAEAALGLQSPRVALLSNGEEAGKGNTLVKEATHLLEGAGLNFIGNVEPKEFYRGEADVVVTDGFAGNVFLKTSEAVAGFLVDIIRQEIKASPISAMGGLMARPAFRRVGAVLDPAKYGAAPLLGVDGLVFIGHGRSSPEGVFNGLRVARQAAEAGLLDSLRAAIQARLSQIPDPAPETS
jgi:glycerol-3-phosphate acyltransferase PlsX